MSGIIMPRPGDGGPFVCRKCGNSFHYEGNRERWLPNLISTVINSDFVRCPKCGSFRTGRDPYYAN